LNVGPFVALLMVGACASSASPEGGAPSLPARSQPLHFAYPLVDGNGVLRAEALRGEPTLVTFITTYDLASQAQARFVSSVFGRHRGRVHATAVVLEPAENLPLVLAFRDALKLPYPLALGDEALIGGEGPFGDVHAVPSTVLLDGEGRLIWKHVGLAKEDELEKALAGT
jgi:hypothetical protein